MSGCPVTDEREARAAVARDGSIYEFLPAAVAYPRSAEEIAEALVFARREGARLADPGRAAGAADRGRRSVYWKNTVLQSEGFTGGRMVPKPDSMSWTTLRYA